MMDMVFALAALGAAVLGGFFLTFSDFMMRSLGLASGPAGMEVMQVINREVFRSSFIVMFFGYAVLSVGAIVWGSLYASPWAVAGGASYLLGTMVTTGLGNVPMNERLDSGEGGLDYWAHYVTRWTQINHLRVVSCLITALCFLQAALALAA